MQEVAVSRARHPIPCTGHRSCRARGVRGSSCPPIEGSNRRGPDWYVKRGAPSLRRHCPLAVPVGGRIHAVAVLDLRDHERLLGPTVLYLRSCPFVHRLPSPFWESRGEKNYSQRRTWADARKKGSRALFDRFVCLAMLSGRSIMGDGTTR